MSLNQIVAPNTLPGKLYSKYNLFMGGTITGSWNWHKALYDLLLDKIPDASLTLLNPRREHWDMQAPREESRRQIEWEYNAFQISDAIVFYYSSETVAPIVMFEVGVYSQRKIPIFICVHPDYPRRFDVEVQLSLYRPDIKIVYSLEDLTNQIVEWYNAN